MEKQCSKCKEIKPLDAFHRTKVKRDGHTCACKVCRNAYARQKHYAGPKRPYAHVSSEQRRIYRRLGMHGISNDTYNEMFINQKGKCAICGKLQSEFNYPLFVDHDHKTGKVRGLLCAGCNTGLGFFEKLHKEMQAYLA